MLELKPNCEKCNKELPHTSDEAYICSYECTFCEECSAETFKFICPHCQGNIEKRPKRNSKEA